MGNVGSPDHLVVNSNWILKQGDDQYILKNTLTLDLARLKFRDAIELGPVNTFGAGDHSITVQFEADITKTINWANLNARDIDGFLTNLPYTLELKSKTFTGSGSGANVILSIDSEGRINAATINDPGSNYTSILLSLSGGGSPNRVGKIVGIISGGELVRVVIVDPGEGYSSAPTVTETEVSSPVAFEFNAEVGSVSFAQAESEGRVKIEAVLTITDDAVTPVDA